MGGIVEPPLYSEVGDITGPRFNKLKVGDVVVLDVTRNINYGMSGPPERHRYFAKRGWTFDDLLVVTDVGDHAVSVRCLRDAVEDGPLSSMRFRKVSP